MEGKSKDAAVDFVQIAFRVSRKGLPKEARVMESSDPCFEETAIAAVRSWTYEPRRSKNGTPQEDELETRLIFELEAPTFVESYDARPRKRVHPDYPERCMRRANEFEIVRIRFDVTESGDVDNIRIFESTNECLNSSVLEAAAAWEYAPKVIQGEPVRRNNVETQFTFKIAGGRKAPEDRMRRHLQRVFHGLQSSVFSHKNPEKALKKLAEIEERYGDTFTRAESSVFHRLRGVARLDMEDYRGALDDFRATANAGAADASIMTVIFELEQAIAQEDAAAAARRDRDALVPIPPVAATVSGVAASRAIAANIARP